MLSPRDIMNKKLMKIYKIALEIKLNKSKLSQW